MRVLKFTGNLVDIMGEKARKKWDTECGLKYHQGHQKNGDGDTVTLMEVIDEAKAAEFISKDGVEVLTEKQADDLLVKDFDKDQYKKYDDALYSANINKLVSDGIIDLNEMSTEWTDQQELDFLYKKGVSGIKKKSIITEKFSVKKETDSKVI